LIRSYAKPITRVVSILILGAQLIALGHSHQANLTGQFNAQPQVVADDGLCALCLLAFHTPLNPAVTPLIVRPYAEIRLVDPSVTSLHVSIPLSSCRTRAPPGVIV
jgi:hypothetical protein